MNRKKLSIDEQIMDMKSKGISFIQYEESDAKRFLQKNTYYFKLKAFERNYDKYNRTEKKGQYINLDFAYLVELSTIDMYLRKIILSMALDIEHALKVQLICDLTQNDDADGYSIVKEYLNDSYPTLKSIHDKVDKSAMSDLIKKRQSEDDNYAMWEIVEVLSFGHFIDLYKMYYYRYPKKHEFSSFLWSLKFLRNAAAHNNCLINSIKSPYNVVLHKNKDILFEISKIKAISSKSRDTWMKNPVVHDFVIFVYVYLNVIQSTGIKQKGIEQLNWLFNERMIQHKEYFEKNLSIKECYKFVSKIVTTLCNKYRK